MQSVFSFCKLLCNILKLSLIICSHAVKLSELMEMFCIYAVQYGSHKPHEASATEEMDL